MNSADKRKTMFFIWGAFVFAALFTFSNETAITGYDVLMALLYVIAVLITSRFILYAPSADAEPTKVKHEDLRHLLNSLTDQEVSALRDRLSDDGEVDTSEEVRRERKGRF